MKKFLTTLVVAGAAALPFAALAGDGYRCTNQCPLAKQASSRRAMGDESARVSEVVRHDLAETVAKNLARI